MLDICGLREEQMAKIYESYEPVGTLKPEMAAELGLPEQVIVAAGAGDNAAAAVGTGTVGEGKCNISLGTSGTIFISSEHFGVDQFNGLHSFALHSFDLHQFAAAHVCAPRFRSRFPITHSPLSPAPLLTFAPLS